MLLVAASNPGFTTRKNKHKYRDKRGNKKTQQSVQRKHRHRHKHKRKT